MLHYNKEKNMKNLAISGWNWASMHMSIFQWIGLREKYRQNLSRISCFTMFYTPSFIGVSCTLHTRDISRTNRMLDLRMRTTMPFGGNIDRVGVLPFTSHQSCSMVVTSQWLLLEIHDVSKIYSIIMWAMKNTPVLPHQTGSLIGIPLVIV